MRLFIWTLILTCCAPAFRVAGETPAADEAALQFFETRIRPVLVEHCYSCHSANAKKLKGELYLDSRAAVLKGGESGPAIEPGDPGKSRLVEAIGYKNVDLQMPPKDKLPEAQIADLIAWVKMGAPWPNDARTGASSGPAKGNFDLQQRKASHWAWQPIKVQAPPPVKNAAWVKDPSDRFILAALEAKGLAPAGPADKRTLIRRATFDLIGLPPTPQEVEAFLADSSPNAFEKVVDRLLASPHFGERWARHWMDLARYAESYGHEFDYTMAYAWQYRDYLIRAFNADLPYDQFVIEQLAGDLLSKPRLHPTEGYNESIIGTGFWFLGEQVHSPVDVRQHQADRVDNQIDTMGKTFLALTLGCARCHDHKFDAISQKDVYALWGFAESTRRQDALLDPGGRIHSGAKKLTDARLAGTQALSSGAPAKASEAGEEFSRYLGAARKVLAAGPQAGEPIAIGGQTELDAARLARWVAALSEEAVKHLSHPMYASAVLKDGPGVADRRAKIAAKLADEKQAADEALAHAPLFKDFADGNFNGWYVTGEAFGPAPTRAGEWDSVTRAAHFTEMPAAHSGFASNRLQGVLRSPDFKLEHDTILYHAAGRGGQIRLIVDGFTMDVFNKLLFGGHHFTVDNEKLQWIAQTKDVGRYIGHRAHIEIIDDGDGWVAVDQIRFTDGKVPALTSPPSTLAASLANDARMTSAEMLSNAYGAAWERALTQWAAGSLDAQNARLVNWALDHHLVEFDPRAAAHLKEIASTMDGVSSSLLEPMRVVAAADGDGVDEHVYIRGSHKLLGEVASRRFLEAISGPNQAPVGSRSGRLELARRLTDASNPLLPRVMVNRLWHHLFGRGIVPSVDNFGVLGVPPSHPELLDFLADRFVREGWSIKRAIRELMLSGTYQMSAAANDAKAEEADPQNTLLHRMNVRRLEGEAIRDAMLAVSGRLDPAMFGPPVDVNLTAFMDGRGKPAKSGPLDGAGRRSIYTAVRRNFLPPMMLAFDTPTPFSTIGRRSVSNVPAQALILMNDPLVAQQADLWARRVEAQKASTSDRIGAMYERAFSRPPTGAEIAAGVAFLKEQAEAIRVSPDDQRVWADYAQVLMNLKEFIFLN